MKLMTKQIEKRMPPLMSTEEIPLKDKLVAVKFFTPDSYWTWYAFEGKQHSDGDWEFFGLVKGIETEYGTFYLSELESARGPLGLPVQRDMYAPETVPECDYPLWEVA